MIEKKLHVQTLETLKNLYDCSVSQCSQNIRIVLEIFVAIYKFRTPVEDGDKIQHNSTQTPSDMSPAPCGEEYLPQAQHQNPGHCIASFSTINRMRMNTMLTDVQLSVGGEIINAHKVILAASSPYFYAMFQSEYFHQQYFPQ